MRLCTLALLAACLSSPSVTLAQQVQLPPGGAFSASAATDIVLGNPNAATPASCYDGMGATYVTGVSTASVATSCTFAGPLFTYPSTFDAGTFTTTNSASFQQGGALHARSSVVGTLGAQTYVSNYAKASYTDAITVTGPFTPASLVFTLAIHGQFTDTYGTTANEQAVPPNNELIQETGRLDLWAINFDGLGNSGALSNISGTGVIAAGDGSTQTGSYSVPWSQFAFGNTLGFQLELIAFSNARNATDVPASVMEDADYSQTAQLQSVAVFDANGRDITNDMNISFASASTTAPEPTSMILLATGLIGVFGAYRRRRNASAA